MRILNYHQIKSWVLSRFPGWQYSDDLMQFICLSILEGRTASYYHLYVDFMRKYMTPEISLDTCIADKAGLTENDLIWRIDLNRPILRYMAFKPQKPTKTSKEISCNSVEVRGLKTGMMLRYVEYEFILSTLRACGGNRTHAAKVLGISIRTMRNKLSEINSLQNKLN
jgi:hypothetical protein